MGAQEKKGSKVEGKREIYRRGKTSQVQGHFPGAFALATADLTQIMHDMCHTSQSETDTGLDLGARALAQRLSAKGKGDNFKFGRKGTLPTPLHPNLKS